MGKQNPLKKTALASFALQVEESGSEPRVRAGGGQTDTAGTRGENLCLLPTPGLGG